jgi:hypothetical protein
VRVADATPFARAASIASAAVLVHSSVDYPLRTGAISACFAMCLALLVERRVRSGATDSVLWPTGTWSCVRAAFCRRFLGGIILHDGSLALDQSYPEGVVVFTLPWNEISFVDR